MKCMQCIMYMFKNSLQRAAPTSYTPSNFTYLMHICIFYLHLRTYALITPHKPTSYPSCRPTYLPKRPHVVPPSTYVFNLHHCCRERQRSSAAWILLVRKFVFNHVDSKKIWELTTVGKPWIHPHQLLLRDMVWKV